jgi:hypothetical protein
MRAATLYKREMFIPLAHAARRAQANFHEVPVRYLEHGDDCWRDIAITQPMSSLAANPALNTCSVPMY